MSQLAIRLDGRTAFEPGETISVEIEWSLPSPVDAIELRAVWNTVGKGTKDVGIEEILTIASPNVKESRLVNVALPTAPYSFSGTLISLVWALELVVLPSGAACRQEITIAPEGLKIELTAQRAANARS